MSNNRHQEESAEKGLRSLPRLVRLSTVLALPEPPGSTDLAQGRYWSLSVIQNNAGGTEGAQLYDARVDPMAMSYQERGLARLA